MKPIRFLRSVPDFNFMRWHRLALAFSALLVVISIVTLGVRGLNYGIDFQGGILLEVGFEDPPNIKDLRDILDGANFGDIEIQEFGAPEHILIRVQKQAGDEKAQLAAISRIKELLGTDLDYRRTEFVGPKIGEELKWQGIWAVLYAVLAMVLYIWLRFERWQFGLTAVLALAHDIMLTIGVFAALRLEFNLATIAALLTIAGYSINDTVVIFDRLRENIARQRGRDLGGLINQSLNATMPRTLMTSLTTLLALMALFIFGGAVIRDFVFAMMWGVLVGTWSSVFIAAPLLGYFKMTTTALDADAVP